MIAPSDFDYELLDCGDGRRIERFGDFTLDRPCPAAKGSLIHRDLKADIIFHRNETQKGWPSKTKTPETWPIKLGPIQAELRRSSNGQVGLFPEQLENWKWIAHQVSTHNTKPLKILNLFAYTGMSTLFASQPHTQVCHVDGAKSSINWAKRNAELSSLSDNAIRWICDDVTQFCQREVRRGQQYDAIILDPPAFGRGDKKEWKIERDLPLLMDLTAQLLSPDPLFVILTCHAPKHFSPADLAQRLENLPSFQGKTAERLHLEIPSSSGHPLLSSFGARISRSA